MFGFKNKHRDLAQAALASNLERRSRLLDEACGIGLWDAFLVNGDSGHAESTWTWSGEMRRLLGFSDEASFPNVVSSWSDRVHPDDASAVSSAFGACIADKSGESRYDIIYRMRTREGNYRWFRGTGGATHIAETGAVHCCGSLTDVHDQIVLKEEARKAAEEDRIIIDVLSSALQSIAAGDLTHRVPEGVPAKAADLRENFNRASESLSFAVGNTTSVIDRVSNEATELSHGSNELAKRTEIQASSLEETATALGEMASRVETAARVAARIAQKAEVARGSTERSNQVVVDATSAISRIRDASHRITEIIAVIDDIAFQTNILALNAAVEAARAGDSGKGFAVVAQEVRELAQRSGRAAKEIRELITDSSAQVDEGVKHVANVKAALDDIADNIHEISGDVDEYARSSQSQADAVREIDAAVATMNLVTQQNAALAEQACAATLSLTRELADLRQSTSKFKVSAASKSRNSIRVVA